MHFLYFLPSRPIVRICAELRAQFVKICQKSKNVSLTLKHVAGSFAGVGTPFPAGRVQEAGGGGDRQTSGKLGRSVGFFMRCLLIQIRSTKTPDINDREKPLSVFIWSGRSTQVPQARRGCGAFISWPSAVNVSTDTPVCPRE